MLKPWEIEKAEKENKRQSQIPLYAPLYPSYEEFPERKDKTKNKEGEIDYDINYEL